MKKQLSSLLVFMFVLGWGSTFAQCPINNSDVTLGVTPTNSDDTLTQGVLYSQTFDVYVPINYTYQSILVTVDSIHIDSISGAPNGGTWVYNPTGGNGKGGTIAGGHAGAICFTATTSSPVGAYPLTFHGTVYTNVTNVPISALGAAFTYTFNVKAPAQTGVAPVAAFTASPDTACVNADIQLTDHSTNTPTSWSWTLTGGTPSSSNSQFPLVSYATAGTYTVKLVVTNSTGSDSTTNSVLVVAGPSATVTTTTAHGATGAANGSAIVAATGGTAPYSYSWNPGASTSDTLSGVAAGTYTVTVTDHSGCSTTASGVVSFVSGILQLGANQQVKVYPNPASTVINLAWTQKSNAEVSILDLNGNVISTYVTSGQTTNVYDVHSLATGTYILRITDKTSNEQQSMLFSKF